MATVRAWILLLALPALARPVRSAEPSWPMPTAPAAAVGAGERDVAVIVGIEKYSRVHGLAGADSNARLWYDYLTKTRGADPSNVRLLLEADATKESILKAIEWGAGRAFPEGALWFIFIGRGEPVPGSADQFLVGVDVQQDQASLPARSLKRSELLAVLGRSSSPSVRVFLDAGFLGRPAEGPAAKAHRPIRPGLVVLSAAREDGFAGVLPQIHRQAFSYLALGGLRGWAGPKKGEPITAGKLWRYTSLALAAVYGDSRQQPELMGDEDAALGPSAGEPGPDLKLLAARRNHELESSRKASPVTASNPVPYTTDGANRAGIEWIAIPGGRYTMGSSGWDLFISRPAHEATVKAFQMAKAPATFRQYRRCVAAGACTPPHLSDGTCLLTMPSSNGDLDNWRPGALPASFQGDDQPVVCVNWEQARAFARWAGGRLPNEEEWEYAATNLGATHKYPWGEEDATCDKAVINDDGLGCGRKTTWPVCSKPAGNTRQGLCDMVGNVWTWLENPFFSYDGTSSGGLDGRMRAGRGGAWNYDFIRARTSERRFNIWSSCFDNLGVRPAK